MTLSESPSIVEHIYDHLVYGNSPKYITEEFFYPMDWILLIAEGCHL